MPMPQARLDSAWWLIAAAPSIADFWIAAQLYSWERNTKGKEIQAHVYTAHAKGLSRARVLLRHALPNAILPIIAMIGIDIGIFMGGIVVVESVFGWPGIGQLAWQAIQRVDIPIIMGVTLVSACAIVIGNLVADIASLVADPRIKVR